MSVLCNRAKESSSRHVCLLLEIGSQLPASCHNLPSFRPANGGANPVVEKYFTKLHHAIIVRGLIWCSWPGIERTVFKKIIYDGHCRQYTRKPTYMIFTWQLNSLTRSTNL